MKKMTKKRVANAMKNHGMNSTIAIGNIVDFDFGIGRDDIILEMKLQERAEKNAVRWGWINQNRVLLNYDFANYI